MVHLIAIETEKDEYPKITQESIPNAKRILDVNLSKYVNMEVTNNEVNLDLANLGGHPRFYELIKICIDTFIKKDHDYAGKDAPPLEGLRQSKRVGVPSWISVLLRIQEKMGRIESHARGTIWKVDEGMSAETRDISIYALIMQILYEEEKADTIYSKIKDLPDHNIIPPKYDVITEGYNPDKI